MPPKSSKKKPATAPEDEADKPIEPPLPTEREVQLSQHLEDVTVELKSMRLQVEELKQENEFLQQKYSGRKYFVLISSYS